MPTRKHFVIFYSPGTFFSEDATRSIAVWDTAEAAQMAHSVTARYGAKPFGFCFSTCIVSEPIPDGEGGTLDVQPAEVARSAMYFLTGAILTYAQIEQRAKENPKEFDILRNNMRCNDWPLVIENRNSWRCVQPFEASSILLDAKGKELDRGDASHWMEARKRFAEWRAEYYRQR